MAAFLIALFVGLICVLIVSVWRRSKQQGQGGASNLIHVLAWLIGFGLARTAINHYFEPAKHAADSPRPTLEGATEFTHGPDASIFHVGVTQDGHTAISLTAGGQMSVWDTRTGEERWQLKAQGISSPAFSRSGQLLAVVVLAEDFTRDLRIFSTSSGKLLARLGGRPVAASDSGVDEVVFSHDGRYLLARGNHTKDISLYPLGELDSQASLSPSSPQEVGPIIVPREANTEDSPHSYFPHTGFSADDSSLFNVTRNRWVLEHWSVEENPRLLSSSDVEKTTRVTPDGLSDDGELAFECDSHSISLAPTDATSMSEVIKVEIPVKLPPGSYNPTSRCDLSPDKEWLALGLNEGSGRVRYPYSLGLWKANNGRPVLMDAEEVQQPAAGEPEVAQVASMAFSPDSAYLYVMDDRLRLHIYALGESIKIAVIPPEQMGFKGTKAVQRYALVAASNTGAVVSVHGASKAVWVPLVNPP